MSSICDLSGKVIFITGGSRGIGRSIALRAAKDGANVVIAAKTAEPHPKLPGTIYSVAEEVEKAGGKALPCVVDIRYEHEIQEAVDRAVKVFGGIDILINNASAISLTKTTATSMKSYDLMNNVNARGTFLCSKLCIPFLRKAENPHILTLSPPLNLNPKWFSNHLAYTIAKYGMSMCVLGMASELRPIGIAVNALWPRTAIYTAATKMIGGGESFAAQCRHPEIMSDAAHVILTRSAKDPTCTGNFFIDENVLRGAGETDFDKYAVKLGNPLAPDFFLDDESQTTEAEEGDPTAPTIDSIFVQLEKMLSEDIVKSVGAAFHFTLTGAQPGIWFIDLRTGKGRVGKANEESTEFDCRFEMTSEAFAKMFEGKLMPSKAFMSGEMHIDGDVFSAIKLEKLLRKMVK
ncbi:hypothetical protein EG68_06442 [Paragonimus skrjabini miyazakii]|uniref:Hydroxysteroid dehydrogenase-like protein 2 n=1 Tax=Paragonimus skrjabini miyazakii TaxID=59628 RepID=A0A8S9YN79_9TREM|nr:hypothetical protein EG68_06442 [Paragonimus skrjabini miyazakii]